MNLLFSIRFRLFLNLAVIVAPLCFFVNLLAEEVQKQVDFAAQESKGANAAKTLGAAAA